MKQTQKLSDRELELARVKVRAYDDPLFLGRQLLGRDRLISRIHGEQFKMALGSDRVLLLEPREHLKTTALSEVYPLYRILHNPEIRILLVHKPYREAKGYIQVIRDHLEQNQLLRETFGNYVRRTRWSDEQLTISRRRGVAKEPTVMAASPEHDPVGGHFHIIIADDIVGLKDRYSRAEREKTLRYYQSLYPMLLAGGQFILVGTRWHMADAYTQILGSRESGLKPREDWDVRVTRAIEPDGTVYFPEQFSKERLDQIRRDMGSVALYSAQMLNEPLPEGMRRFDLDKMHFYEKCPEGRAFAFIDPATGEDVEKGDFTVLIVGVRAGTDLYIDHAVLTNEPFERFRPFLVEAAKRYRFPTLYVESNAFQSMFARECGRALAAEGCPVRIGKVKQHRSKQERIDSIETIVLDGQVKFRVDWDRVYPLLIRQLCEWPAGEHDDGPDALEGVIASALGRGVKRKITLVTV